MRLPLEFPKAYTVSEVLGQVRDRLEAGLAAVWVQGEVSNLKPAASGHVYFTLKDRKAQLKVVLFRSKAQALRFALEDGLQVIVRGGLTVYEDRGDLQLLAQAIEPLGAGALALAFEQLKARLHAEGLFDPARKRPLPAHPRRVGIVTSLQGAALADILQVIARRRPALALLIAPVPVQGPGAAGDIARAIDQINRIPDVDVVIVGRGGGSAEDLRAFNEEAVARAILRSRAPVVSAVGHEVDVTISDLVADLRAPTPSVAAELVARSALETQASLDALSRRLATAMRSGLDRRRLRLAQLAAARPLRAVEGLPGRAAQRVDELRQRLLGGIRARLGSQRARLQVLAHALALLDVRARVRVGRERRAHAASRLQAVMRAILARRHSELGLRASRLQALSPLAVLGRGYAIALLPGGEVLKSPEQVRGGDRLDLRLAGGRLPCRVEDGWRS